LRSAAERGFRAAPFPDVQRERDVHALIARLFHGDFRTLLRRDTERRPKSGARFAAGLPAVLLFHQPLLLLLDASGFVDGCSTGHNEERSSLVARIEHRLEAARCEAATR
jgi:hypothetical protein